MVEARLVNDDGTEVEEYGACGELYLRAPTIMKGYFGDEAANATAFDQQGWLRTGDVAIFKKDAEGNAHLFIVDRKKDIMKVKVSRGVGQGSWRRTNVVDRDYKWLQSI